jgi:hypothetical protein
MSLFRVHSWTACIQTYIFVSCIQRSISKSQSRHVMGNKRFHKCNVNVIWIYIHSILLQQHTVISFWGGGGGGVKLLLCNKSNTTHNSTMYCLSNNFNYNILAVAKMQIFFNTNTTLLVQLTPPAPPPSTIWLPATNPLVLYNKNILVLACSVTENSNSYFMFF